MDLKQNERTRFLDKIDLTGDEPIILTEEIKEIVPVVNLDGVIADSALVVTKPNRSCEVCLEELSRYTCPGCKMKTCSGCLDFTVRATDLFFTGNQLNYRFLEEANRLADNAKRDYRNKGVLGKQTRMGKLLYKGATKSGVRLFRMSKGMKRWKENKSQYNLQKKEIYWTVKFVFNDINEHVFVKACEAKTLQNILNTYLDKEKATAETKIIDNHHYDTGNPDFVEPYYGRTDKFASYINAYGKSDVTIFFKQELDRGEENLRYTKCDLKDTLKTILCGKSVLEYPIFHVVLPTTATKLTVEAFAKEIFQSKLRTSDSDTDESSSTDSDIDGD